MHIVLIGGIAKNVGVAVDTDTGKRFVYWRIKSSELEGAMYARSFDEQYFGLRNDDYFQILNSVFRKSKKKGNKNSYLEVFEMIVKPYKAECIDRLRAVNNALKEVEDERD